MPALKAFLREWALTAALLALLLGIFLYLRTPAGPLKTWDDLQGYLGTGRPLLVEVYSNT